VRVVCRQLSKDKQEKLAMRRPGVVISPPKNKRPRHVRGPSLTFFFAMYNEMLFKPGLCPNTFNTLKLAAKDGEEIFHVVIIDIGGRASDVLPKCLDSRLGFDLWNRKISLTDEFEAMNKLNELEMLSSVKLKTKRATAVKRVVLQHSIDKMTELDKAAAKEAEAEKQAAEKQAAKEAEAAKDAEAVEEPEEEDAR